MKIKYENKNDTYNEKIKPVEINLLKLGNLINKLNEAIAPSISKDLKREKEKVTLKQNELKNEALMRELQEEMDIELEVSEEDYFMTVDHSYPDFRIIDVEFPYLPVPEGVPAMRQSMIEGLRRAGPGVDFWWESAGPMAELRGSVQAILNAGDHPVLLAHRAGGVADGALFSIEPDVTASGNQLTGMALKILSGTDPGTIPVLPARSFRLALNLGTARALGLVVPSYLLEMAGDEVYR